MHHSQEELSILTTFRAHPLVHVSFLISAIPILAVASKRGHPGAVLTIYACLGALPHANVRWTYGKLGRILISPAYHRLHHSATGRLDINLGTVFTIWDMLSRRAVFPAAGRRPGRPTGLAGRPVPVEQSGDRAASGPHLPDPVGRALHLDQDGVTMTATRHAQRQHARPRTSGALWLLYLCDAGLLVASGLIHLHLWDIAYRHVKTLDVLFLVQVAACLLLAIALLALRRLHRGAGRRGADGRARSSASSWPARSASSGSTSPSAPGWPTRC